jgi:hypothetical protein
MQCRCRILAVWACLYAFSLAADDLATARPDLEHQVKAVFLLRFAQFTDWPYKEKTSAFVVAIVGPDPFGDYLDRAASALRIDGRPVEVRRFPTAAEVVDLESLALVFVGRSTEVEMSALLASLSRRPILTVSEVTGFVGRGGIIEFVIDRNRVSFRIDQASAKACGLRISSKLLGAAAAVEGN